jgi:large subunit ribosomal protein L13
MKTIFEKPAAIARSWFIIDAEGKSLGRVAARAAAIVRGKEKPSYMPNQEMGDFVVVINCDKIRVTGRKYENKQYHHHTGYPGGLKTETYEKLAARKPAAPLEHAVKGMLPKGPLGRKLFGNVKVYAGSAHPHEAQKPQMIDL